MARTLKEMIEESERAWNRYEAERARRCEDSSDYGQATTMVDGRAYKERAREATHVGAL